MKKLFTLVTAILSMASTSYANNCTDVDISSELGDVRDQGNVGWCFANAAADLLSYRFKSELGGKKVSAMYTALSYDRMYYSNIRGKLEEKFKDKPEMQERAMKVHQTLFPHKIGEGGLMYLTIYSTMRSGLCTQELDQSFSFDPKSKMNLMQKLQIGLDMKAAFDKHEKLNKRGWEDGAMPFVERIRATENILNRISDENLHSLLRGTTKNNFLVAVGDVLCRGHITIPKTLYKVGWRTSAIKFLDSTPKVRSFLGERAAQIYARGRSSVVNWFDNHVIEEIDRQMNIGNPIGVLYYSTLYAGYDLPINYGTDLHASIIVGRRWVPAKKLANGTTQPGQCQFKIRNSWGKGCGGYKNAEIASTCDKGHIWVEREKYKKYLYAATYIDKNEVDPDRDVFPWLSVLRDYKRAPLVFLED